MGGFDSRRDRGKGAPSAAAQCERLESGAQPTVARRESDAGRLQRSGCRPCLRLGSVLLAAGLALLAAVPAHAASEGDLRLQGGASLSHQEGRLEIYHSGEWGTVCDDYFQLQEAEVACKQMGFTGAEELVRGWWWTSSKPIWLDDVDCDGTETSLSQCSNRGWGVHNCDHSEDVRMRCTEATTAAGVLIGKRKLRIDEQDTTGATYSVKLGKVPSGNVTVSIASDNSDVTVNPPSLTFTTMDWGTAQDVTVTAGNDSDTTQDTATLTHTATGGGYGSVTIPSVAVEVNDNDDKGVTVSHQSLTIYEAVTPELSYFQKPNDAYSVVLTGAPSANVTVMIAGHSGTDISLSDSGGTTISSLTFTTSNWSTPQTVTVTAAYDVDHVDEQTVTLTHSATGGGYGTTTNPFVGPSVTVDVDDIYYKGVAVNLVPLTVREGASVGDEFSVVLNGPPTGNVTITFAPPNGENLSFDPARLVFTKNDWRPAKRVHVRQENDGDDQHELVEIALSASGGGYGSVTIPPVEVLLIDNDNGGLPGTPGRLRATPGQGSVGLNWDPPLEDPEKPVQNYEYQQEGESAWTPTNGPETNHEVKDLTSGESYKFRVRAVNSEGKGAASEPSAPVTPAPAGLTASFDSVPASHDGSSTFRLELAFSEAVFDGSEPFDKNRAIQDALEVAGGTVRGGRRVDPGAFDRWIVWIRPSGNGAVTVTLPATTGACSEAGAICTPDGEPLAEAVSVSVPGPATPEVSIAAGTSPVTEGTDAVFTLSRTGDASGALTVGLGVREDGAVLSGTAPTEAVFAAGSATVALNFATEDDEVVEDASVVTATLASGTGYALDASASEATVTVDDDDAASNAAPTGLPTIAGTARVGETLTASAADIADADGLTGATFAWQWIAHDGTADANIAGATSSTYTLTSAEAGKTVKVRAIFTDDGGKEETLVSAATASVAALPVISIAAASPSVTEGGAASFTLSRTGDAAGGADSRGRGHGGRLRALWHAGFHGDLRGRQRPGHARRGDRRRCGGRGRWPGDGDGLRWDRLRGGRGSGLGRGRRLRQRRGGLDGGGDALDRDAHGAGHRRRPSWSRLRQQPEPGQLVGGRGAVPRQSALLLPATRGAGVHALGCAVGPGAVDAASGRPAGAARRRRGKQVLLLDGNPPRLAGGPDGGGEAHA